MITLSDYVSECFGDEYKKITSYTAAHILVLTFILVNGEDSNPQMVLSLKST